MRCHSSAIRACAVVTANPVLTTVRPTTVGRRPRDCGLRGFSFHVMQGDALREIERLSIGAPLLRERTGYAQHFRIGIDHVEATSVAVFEQQVTGELRGGHDDACTYMPIAIGPASTLTSANSEFAAVELRLASVGLGGYANIHATRRPTKRRLSARSGSCE